MSGDTFPLAGEFPTPSRDEWLSLVDKALKGAPFDKMLVSRTYDGITIQPLYGRGDRPGEGDPSGFPGAAPFTRGARAAGATAGWDVRQLHLHPDPGTCNAEIRRDIERGVTSLRLRLHAAARRGLDSDAGGDLTGEDGVIIDRLDDLDRALKDIDLVAAPVSLEPGAAFAAGAALMAALWRRRGIADGDARGTFGADPLGTLAAEGALTQGLDDALAALGALAAATAATYGPGVRSVMVDTRPYHGAGATSSQDLAIAMATGVAYLRALTAAGMDIDAACGQIAFTLAVDCNQFQSIAKLRAARRLWARVTQACGASDGARGMVVNAETAHRMLTRRDPWVNMLRATVAAFAAGVGGADSVTVLSFDSALGEPGELGRRMARNTQLVLQEESNLHRVIDPAGGAWYPEHLTDDLCTAAWALFQEIEGKGGMAQALTSGWIGQTLDAAFAAREKNLDKRKDPLTGVSEFPNIHEAPVSPEDVDLDGLRAAAAAALPADRGAAPADGSLAALTAAALAGATVGTLAGGGTGGVAMTPLPSRRLAEGFEALRDVADAFKVESGAFPAIFLANMGPIAVHTARATFAKNFFEAGGIEALGNSGFPDAEAAAKAYAETGAELAIICSSDTVYEDLAEDVARALKAAGAKRVFLAGRPAAEAEAKYRAAGVDAFIFLGCDARTTLRGALADLGVIDR